ncbi:DUF4871 domain-containing protein [Paenibacillus ferrarius]|uniref:DUF4871 domain-containing protein n=1 Tax=Paenibacillus ferrarius TaxID=1469647 RepID=UPI003D2B950A
MGEDKPTWAGYMADSPFVTRQFTADLKQSVMQRVDQPKRNKRFLMWAVSAPLVAALLVMGWPLLADELLPSKAKPNAEMTGEPAARHTYFNALGQRLFTVSPEPYAEAGKSVGYMFHFDEPFDIFAGKRLTLQAVHQQSGFVQTLSTAAITMPSPGYSGLDRYTVHFVLPLAGMWQVNVLLDDAPYGNAELFMLEPSWDISPEFQSGSYKLRGAAKKVGFIDAGFVAGKVQKYMWHFWGEDDELNGPFEVKAVKQGTNKVISVYTSNPLSSGNALAGALNGADRTTITSMSLPEAGRWRLLPYVQGRLLDTIVVEAVK